MDEGNASSDNLTTVKGEFLPSTVLTEMSCWQTIECPKAIFVSRAYQ
jgi:hypothetical protein